MTVLDYIRNSFDIIQSLHPPKQKEIKRSVQETQDLEQMVVKYENDIW